MSEPIDQPLDDDDRLADPPLVDLLHYERSADGYAITFIPRVGNEQTQFVWIPRSTTHGKRVSAFVSEIEKLAGGSLEKATHGGGGDYTLRLVGGRILSLSDEAVDAQWATDVFNRLKQIADVAEIEFNMAHAGQH